MATARALHLLPPVEDEYVAVSRVALEQLVANAASLCQDVEAGLSAARMHEFQRSPAAVIDDLNRIGHRMERFAEDFEPLGGIPTEPRPLRLA